MCARKIPLDYRRHLEMQVPECLVTYIFPSTSTLLNPMRPSSQSFAGRVALFDNPSFACFTVCFVPNSITFSNPISKRLNLWDTQTNELIAPYRENYVHRILFFYVRISLTSNDQGPAGPDPAGGPARPVQ